VQDKLATLADAVAGLVRDGDSVVMGACLEHNIPFAVAHEFIRQNRRDLEMVAPISDACTDMLIGAGCVGAVSGAWVGSVSGGLGHNYRRACEAGVPRRVQVNDYSNLALGLALHAGATGLPFVPMRSLLGSDIVVSNPAFRRGEDPFGGGPVVLVPALRPDVAVLAVQRADRFGNVHHWGNAGVAQEAALAAERVIVVAEEIVAPEVIASDPNRVLFPGFVVSAVVHAPAAVHPAPMVGHWKRDNAFFQNYHARSRERDGFRSWLSAWVLETGDHDGYRAKLGARLDELRVRGQAPSAPANFAAE